MDEFLAYLNGFKINKDDPRKATHTIMPGQSNITSLNWAGRYYVENENLLEFNNSIKNILKKHPDKNFAMTETFGEHCPLLIDIDTLYENSEKKQRFYTKNTIKEIIKVIWPHINYYFDSNHENKEECWITEKVSPTITKEGDVKDGLHIIFPNIIGKYKIFKEFMTTFHNNIGLCEQLINIFRDTSIDNVIPSNDVKTIMDSNVQRWMVYGCGKMGKDGIPRPYLLTSIVDCNTFDMIDNQYSHEEISKKICLINKFENNVIYKNNIDKKKDIPKSTSVSTFSMFDESSEEDDDYDPYLESRNNDAKNAVNKLMEQELQNIKDIVMKCLSIERAMDYGSWLKVGMCLKNIGGDSLLELWEDFSMRYSKYKDGTSKRKCSDKWKSFTKTGITRGSLNHWAQQDNYSEYMKIIEKSLDKNIRNSIFKGGHHDDIAEVVSKYYAGRYLSVDLKDGWYWFNGHKWVKCPKGYRLQKSLTGEIKELYHRYNLMFKNGKEDANKDEDEQAAKSNEDGEKGAYEIYVNLKNVTFQEKIMTACKLKFYEEKVMERMDSNTKLIGFENCVFDLDRNELREGRPEDYISMSNNLNMPIHQNELPLTSIELSKIIQGRVGKYNIDETGLKEWNKELWDNGDKRYYKAISKDIKNFFKQILPDKDLLKYCLRCVASRLSGDVLEQRFSFWTGSGGNGKSILMDLIRYTFGEYCTNLPVTLLTQKRKASNAASPELARTRGVRLCYMQEPDTNERINSGAMKELSGGDIIMARELYTTPFEFKPQFEIVLMCNEKPSIDDKSNGSWRRIQVYPFVSRFIDDKSQWDITTGKTHHIYPRNKELSQNLKEWPIIFMTMLLNEWVEMGGVMDDSQIPDKIRFETDKFKNQSDIIGQWIKQDLKECGGGAEGDGTIDTTDLQDLQEAFSNWANEEFSNCKIDKNEVKKYLIDWQKKSKYGFSRAANGTDRKPKFNLIPIDEDDEE